MMLYSLLIKNNNTKFKFTLQHSNRNMSQHTTSPIPIQTNIPPTPCPTTVQHMTPTPHLTTVQHAPLTPHPTTVQHVPPTPHPTTVQHAPPTPRLTAVQHAPPTPHPTTVQPVPPTPLCPSAPPIQPLNITPVPLHNIAPMTAPPPHGTTPSNFQSPDSLTSTLPPKDKKLDPIKNFTLANVILGAETFHINSYFAKELTKISWIDNVKICNVTFDQLRSFCTRKKIVGIRKVSKKYAGTKLFCASKLWPQVLYLQTPLQCLPRTKIPPQNSLK